MEGSRGLEVSGSPETEKRFRSGAEVRDQGEAVSLESRMHRILTQLELVSHGTVQSIGFTTGGEGDSPTPAGCKGAEHLLFRALWDEARSDAARRRVLVEAEERWLALTGRSRRVKILQAVAQGESKDDRDARIVREGEGFTAREAAIHFRCAEADVKRARLGAGREPALGLVVGPPPAEDERRARVVELRERHNMTERQIVMMTGVPKSTVRRILGRAA